MIVVPHFTAPFLQFTYGVFTESTEENAVILKYASKAFATGTCAQVLLLYILQTFQTYCSATKGYTDKFTDGM